MIALYLLVLQQFSSLSTTTTNQHEDADAVWLVDHAWTFVCSQKSSRQLARHALLLKRMAALVGIDGGGNKDDDDSGPAPDPAIVLRGLWPHANMYKLSGVPGYPTDEAIWYVMDEFGARIGHADEPSLGMAPFYFQPEGCMYSVLWALRDMEYGDEATRGAYIYDLARLFDLFDP